MGLNHPIAIRYPRGRGVISDWKSKHFGNYQKIEIGKAFCLKAGTKVAVLSSGAIGKNITQAIASNPESDLIAHYDFSFVKPLDEKTLHYIFTTFESIFTVEDGVVKGGFGSAICEFAAKHNYHVKIDTLGVPDEFIEHGTVEELQQSCKIDVQSLAKLFLNV